MDQFNELITSGRLTELLLPWGIKIGFAALIFLAGRWIAKLATSSVDLAVRRGCARKTTDPPRGDLLENIKTGLEDGGCSLPYPQQDVHLYKAGE